MQNRLNTFHGIGKDHPMNTLGKQTIMCIVMGRQINTCKNTLTQPRGGSMDGRDWSVVTGYKKGKVAEVKPSKNFLLNRKARLKGAQHSNTDRKRKVTLTWRKRRKNSTSLQLLQHVQEITTKWIWNPWSFVIRAYHGRSTKSPEKQCCG